MTASGILSSHREGVVSRSRACGTVLAIQDTTDLDFTSHRGTQGLGFINQTQQQGLKVHTCFAVSGEGEPLGLLEQHCWSRPQRQGQKEQRHHRPIEQKESYRWLTTAAAAEAALPETLPLVHVADREADIFELFAQPRRLGSELLVRAAQNRRVQQELGTLLPTINAAPIWGEFRLEVPRARQREARTALLQVQALTVTLAVPVNAGAKGTLKPVEMGVIQVQEAEPPSDGTKPIRWVLLTTLALSDLAAVLQAVRWYSYRWLIERFHYTLKSGCGLEQLQLNCEQRLVKALATYSIVAWRLLWLTYRARLTPEASCERVLETAEWQLLRRRFAPKSRSRKPPTLGEAVTWIAQLGGFLARKGDGHPGVKALWRGLTRLHDWMEGRQLAAELQNQKEFD